MITAGIDCGAENTKAVIVKDGAIIGRGSVYTGFDPEKAVESCLAKAMESTGIQRFDIDLIGGTGSVRRRVGTADINVHSVEAMARAADLFFPGSRMVFDVGAVEARAVKLDGNGGVENFVVNEKCAAGAGVFIETMAHALGLELTEIGPMALRSNNKIPMNAQCVIFAEREVPGLIRAGYAKADISRAVHDAMAGRIVTMILRIGVNEDVVMIGGVARNPALIEAVRRELEVDGIYVPDSPEYGAAVGAAMAAAEKDRMEPRLKCRPGGGMFEGCDVLLRPGSAAAGNNKQDSDLSAWTRWRSPDMDWKAATFVTVGIDVGSVSSQACIMADGRIFAYAGMRTGSGGPGGAEKAFDFVLEAADMPEDRIDYCVGTGYGRVNVPFADRTITETACHARGANFLYGPGVRTVLDVGGQDIKAVRCDEKGKVTGFLVNDRCAAGTGRAMEVFAELLGVRLNDVGERSFQVEDEPPPVSNACVVYARSEAAALLRHGRSIEYVLAACCRAVAESIHSFLERAGVSPGFAVTGGMAGNSGVMDRLMPLVGLERMKTDWDPRIAGAVGAALFGYKLCIRGKGRRSPGAV